MDSSAEIVAGIIDDDDLEAFAFLDEVNRSPTTQLIQEPTETNLPLKLPMVLSQEPETKSPLQNNTIEHPMVASDGKETISQKENVTLLARSVMKALALMQTSKNDTKFFPETRRFSNSDALESGEIDSDTADDSHFRIPRSVHKRVDEYFDHEVSRLQFCHLSHTENEYQFQSTHFHKGVDASIAEVGETKSLRQKPKNELIGENPNTSVREHSRFYELEIDSQNVKSLKRKRKKHKRNRSKTPNLTSDYTSMSKPHFEFSASGEKRGKNSIEKKHKRNRSKTPNLTSDYTSMSEPHFEFSAISGDKVMVNNSSKRITSAPSDDSDISAISMSSVITVKRGDTKRSLSPLNPLTNLSSHLQSRDSTLLAPQLQLEPPLLEKPKKRKKNKAKKSKEISTCEVPVMGIIEPESSLTLPVSLKSRRGSRLHALKRVKSNSSSRKSIDSSCDSSSPLRGSKSLHTRLQVSALPSDRKKGKVKKLKKKLGKAKDKKHKIKSRSKSTGHRRHVKKSQPEALESIVHPQSSLNVISLGSIREKSRSRSLSLVKEMHTEQMGRSTRKLSISSGGSLREMSETDIPMCLPNLPQSRPCSNMSNRSRGSICERINSTSVSPSRPSSRSGKSRSRLKQKISNASSGSSREIVESNLVTSPLRMSMCHSSESKKEISSLPLLSNNTTRELKESISLSKSVITSSLNSKIPSPRVIQEMSRSIAISKSVMSLLLTTENLSSGIDRERYKTALPSPPKEPVANPPKSETKHDQISNKRPRVESIEVLSESPARTSRSRSQSRSRSSRIRSRSPWLRSRLSRSRSRLSRSRSRSKSRRHRISSRSKKHRSPLLRRQIRSHSRSGRSHSRNSFDWIYKSRRARGIRSNSRSPVVSSSLPRSRSRGRRTRSRSRSVGKFKRRPKSRSSRKRSRSSSWRRHSRNRSRGRRSLSSRSLTPRLRRLSRHSMSSKRSLSPDSSKTLRERNSLKALLTSISARPALTGDINGNAGTVVERFVPESAGYNQAPAPYVQVPYAFQSVPTIPNVHYQPYNYNVALSHNNRAPTYHHDAETFGRLCSNPPHPGSEHLTLANSVPPPNSFEPPGSRFLGSLPAPVPPANNFEPPGSIFLGSLPNPVPPPSTDFRLAAPIPVPPLNKYKAPSSNLRELVSYPVTVPTSCNITLTGSSCVTQSKKQTEVVNMTKNCLVLCGGLVDTGLAGKSLSAPKPCYTTVGISVSCNENEAPLSSEDDFVSKPVLVGKKPGREQIVINLLSNKQKLIPEVKQVDSPLMDITTNGNKANVELDKIEKCDELFLSRRNLVVCKTREATEIQFVRTEADKPTLYSKNLINKPKEIVKLEPDSSVETNVNNYLTAPRDILTRLRNVVLRQKRSVVTQVDFLNMDLRGSVEVFDCPEIAEHVALFDALRDALK